VINNVGYTEDGNVFFSVNAMVEEKPAQLVVTLSREEALAMAKLLVSAADQLTVYNGETIQ
jgi:hypothetical protein